MDIHKQIGKLPRPKKGFTLPQHKYTGPYNPLHEQLDKNDQPISGQEPFNSVDEVSMKHDICYRDNSTKTGKEKCDDQMIIELDLLEPKNLRERIDRSLVRKIISAKKRLGWGIEWTNKLADELHKPIRRKFKKRIVFAKNVDDIWSADLVDMQSFSKYNNGFKYILMVIDVFSKFGWGVPLKTKNGTTIAEAFEKIFKNNVPAMLWTDKGKEFYNVHLSKVLRKNNVKLYSTENEEKSSVVERWNRTIKTWMWKYFTANNTKRYIDILQSLIDKYNNTKHRAIGCKPVVARQPSSYADVYQKLYKKRSEERAKDPKFRVGEQVRISKKKKTFEKGFTPNWTEEVFTIVEVKPTKPPTYKIQDTRGDSIDGTFYEAELQKSTQEVYRIENIVKKRTSKEGIKEALVKWKGYDRKFNSWIPVSELQRL